MLETTPPILGQQVFYIDQANVAMPAVVTAIDISGSYPRANLSVYFPRGVVKPRIGVQQAYHDGIRARVLNRYLLCYEDIALTNAELPTLNHMVHEE